MADEYINKKDVIDLGITMQTHLWTREQTYKAIFCLPSADVAQVVRCKDCKYGKVDDSDFPTQYLCEYRGSDWNDEDHFCSYGERKDNG